MALTRRSQHLILIGLLLLFGTVFVVRGPVRAVDGGEDLAHLYAASVLWLEGGNPYDGERCVEVMERVGHPDPSHVANGSFYPPSTIATLSVLGLMGWDASRLAWLAVNLACCAVLVWALAGWLQLDSAASRWMAAVLILIAWGPVMTALSLGQLSITAAAGIFAGLICLERGRPWLAGVLLAIGCLIKPQLGLGFLVLVGLRRQWFALGISVALIALVTGLGIWRLMVAAPDWASLLVGNIEQDQAPGQVLDASLGGPLRHQMIDIRPLLHLVLPTAWVNISALLLVGVMAAVAIWRLLRVGLHRYALLASAGVGLLVLLPVYHRVYDATVLLPLLALVINRLLCCRRDALMVVIATLILPLSLPLPSILVVLNQRGVIPDSIHSAWFWEHVVLQHQSWCLLLASIALIAWTYRRAETEPVLAESG